jgi:predicted GTPase
MKLDRVYKVLDLKLKNEYVYFQANEELLQLFDEISYLSDKKKTKLISIIGEQKSGKSFLLNNIFENASFEVGKNRTDKTTDGIDLSLTKDDLQYQIILDCEGLQSQERKEWIENLMKNSSSTLIEKAVEHYNKSLALILYRLSNVLLLYCTSYNNGDLKLLSYIYANKG